MDADDEQYASEDDSDFAPDDAPDQPSDSDGDDDGDGDDAASRLTGKGRRADGRGGARNDDGGGYDNSGDEVVIAKGRKRQKRARDRGDASDDEAGGEGGLVKTRRQRAAQYGPLLARRAGGSPCANRWRSARKSAALQPRRGP